MKDILGHRAALLLLSSIPEKIENNTTQTLYLGISTETSIRSSFAKRANTKKFRISSRCFKLSRSAGPSSNDCESVHVIGRFSAISGCRHSTWKTMKVLSCGSIPKVKRVPGYAGKLHILVDLSSIKEYSRLCCFGSKCYFS